MNSGSRHLWTKKLKGLTQKGEVHRCLKVQKSHFEGFILGIDPSLRGSGFAVLEAYPQGIRLHTSLTLKLGSKYNFTACLGEIFKTTQQFIQTYPIRVVSTEQTVYVQNSRVAHILGSTRGACLAAAAIAQIETYEYAPLRIKKSITGLGRASKEQVTQQIYKILQLTQPLPSDESDAAAAALCHYYTNQSYFSL